MARSLAEALGDASVRGRSAHPDGARHVNIAVPGTATLRCQAPVVGSQSLFRHAIISGVARLTRRKLLATIPAAGAGAAVLHAAIPHSHGSGSTAAAATSGTTGHD